MIRIFVAEDQPLFLQDITTQILSLRDDLTLCGTAYNGQDALEKLLKSGADIVFTDIKMPHLSGLELMEQVKKIYPKTKFVVISGYHDYEYMHKAIQLEADEYLLKPITRSDIQRVVENLCEKIMLEREQDCRETIQRILFSPSNAALSQKPNWGYDAYYVWLLNAGPCVTYGMDIINPFAVLWDRINPEDFAKEHLPDSCMVFGYPGKTSNECLLFLGANQHFEGLEKQLSAKFIQAAKNEAIPLTIGISREICSMDNIRMEEQIVRTLVRKNLVFGKSSILFCRDAALFGRPDFQGMTPVEERELKYGVELHDADRVKRTVLELLYQARQKRTTQLELQRLMNSILRICMANDTTSKEDYQLLIEEALCNAKDYDELINAIAPIFAVWKDQSTFDFGGVSSARLQKAHRYISKHFNEPITIREIAEHFHIEPSYFSRMFKKEFGVTAIEYLTSCRLEQAKLLLKGDRTIHDVAILCGYQDQFYFSRIFKGAIGMSPSEFQQAAAEREH